MKRIKVMTVFGTRPEAIKMAPVVLELNKYPEYITPVVAVTAQHREMLDQVLNLFEIKPDHDLNIMAQGQTLFDITTKAMQGLNEVLSTEKPDIVLVHGDTTTTFAGALAAFHSQIAIGHVEAGLRTWNKYSPYPEEMNRKLTGAIADIHFAPTSTSKNNLLKENIDPAAIVVTGNTVIDALQTTVKADYRFTDSGLQKALADRYKRHHVNGKLYSPMVNLVRYADDFIITCENKETLENEIKPLVAEFMSERGLTLSEEKTVITNVHDGFDFLGFNIRKYGKDILTKPTKKSEKRFMENIRKVIKENKGCRQESLIRMLNSKIRGWGGYYQHGATRDSFHRIDHQIFLSLWQWAKRRHSKKGKRWIKDRYWHDIRGNKWTFASKFKKPNGKEDQLTLLSLTSSFPFLQYTQIKGDMNPFDADCRLYFYKRKKSKMLVTLKGRKSLLYLWEKQGRKCPICGEPIDTHKAWNVMPTVQNGKKCNLLVHDECFKLSRKSNGNKK